MSRNKMSPCSRTYHIAAVFDCPDNIIGRREQRETDGKLAGSKNGRFLGGLRTILSRAGPSFRGEGAGLPAQIDAIKTDIVIGRLIIRLKSDEWVSAAV